MVFNLKIHEINRNIRKLTRTLTLIKKINIYIYDHFLCNFNSEVLMS